MGIHTHHTLLLDAPRTQVWETLSDLTGPVRWSPSVSHAVVTGSTPDGRGTVRRVQVGRVAVLETVTTWTPGTTLAYRIVGLPPVVGPVTTTWSLADRPAGTEVTIDTTLEPPGRAGRLVARLLALRLGRTNTELLAGFAAEVGGPVGTVPVR